MTAGVCDVWSAFILTRPFRWNVTNHRKRRQEPQKRKRRRWRKQTWTRIQGRWWVDASASSFHRRALICRLGLMGSPGCFNFNNGIRDFERVFPVNVDIFMEHLRKQSFENVRRKLSWGLGLFWNRQRRQLGEPLYERGRPSLHWNRI